MRLLIVGCAALSIGVSSLSAFADPGKLVVIGSDSAGGKRAHALVVTPKIRPAKFTAITLKVTSNPRQRVRSGYVATCFEGGARGRQGHDRSGPTPLLITVELRRWDDYCIVVADATLTKKGRVTIQMIARR